VQAIVIEGGNGVQLTWVDRSDDEDAFRIYRDDVEASIGLVPADTEVFVDRSVACGNTYRYSVVAFNAAGASAPEEAQPVTMPPCARATLLSSPSP
jgi:fibronectin type 3 domain-containing protein